MLSDRQNAFNTISRVLALTRLDIEQRQAVSDFSLNIHGENWVRDVFNHVYKLKLVNANAEAANTPFIDLVDTESKRLIQVTTTRSKEKITHTLQALDIAKYSDYEISIYYLLEKASPSKLTLEELRKEHPNLKVEGLLKDSSDLIRDIESLDELDLIELSERYFVPNKNKYTDVMVLDLACKALLKRKEAFTPNYDDDLGSIETDDKITVNNINSRVSLNIQKSLDYTSIIDSIDDGQLSTNLRIFVVDELYKEILMIFLRQKVRQSNLQNKNTDELQLVAKEHNLDFNKIIHRLVQELENKLIITDFNSMEISWILVSYFFEICDVGVKE